MNYDQNLRTELLPRDKPITPSLAQPVPKRMLPSELEWIDFGNGQDIYNLHERLANAGFEPSLENTDLLKCINVLYIIQKQKPEAKGSELKSKLDQFLTDHQELRINTKMIIDFVLNNIVDIKKVISEEDKSKLQFKNNLRDIASVLAILGAGLEALVYLAPNVLPVLGMAIVLANPLTPIIFGVLVAVLIVGLLVYASFTSKPPVIEHETHFKLVDQINPSLTETGDHLQDAIEFVRENLNQEYTPNKLDELFEKGEKPFFSTDEIEDPQKKAFLKAVNKEIKDAYEPSQLLSTNSRKTQFEIANKIYQQLMGESLTAEAEVREKFLGIFDKYEGHSFEACEFVTKRGIYQI